MSSDKINRWKEQINDLERIIFNADRFEESISLLAHFEM